ncbi:MAG: prepilin peptidase [Lachnospiraceae bacterium]|nr:prepilin peptidase [Lachnospiraceae bacterium]
MFLSIYDSPALAAYFVTVAAALGLVMGSFLHCAAWRIVRGESFLKGRSRCPQCGHTLTPAELIPVASWLIQKGRCRNCNSPIPARYPLSELGFAALTVLTLLRFDLTAVCLRNYVFICCLFCLTLTDLDDRIIPDGCHVISALAWAVWAAADFPGWAEVGLHVLSAFAFGGGILGISLVMDKVMDRDTLGGGDIKLVAVAGLYLGFVGTLFMLIIACIIGLAGSRFLQMPQRGSREAGQEESGAGNSGNAPGQMCGREEADQEGPGAFPFGPALAASTCFMLFCGGPLVRWYTGLL